MSRINFGPWADGTKPFVRQAITVEPSAMFSTSLILESVEERYKEGEATIRNSFSLATSSISF